MKTLNEYRIRYVCDGNLLEELTTHTDGYDILDILKVNKDD